MSHASRVAAAAAACTTCDSSGPLGRGAIFKIQVATETNHEKNSTHTRTHTHKSTKQNMRLFILMHALIQY